MRSVLWLAAGLVAGPLLAGDTGAAVLTRGPYLQMGTPESAVVRWRTDVPTSGWIAWGEAPDLPRTSVFDPEPKTEHEMRLDGLSPATRYYYTFGDASAIFAGPDSAYTFRTAPVPGTRETTRIWVIGDSGTGDSNARRVRDAYLERLGTAGLDVWLMLGDNAYSSGRNSEYQEAVFEMYPTILRRAFLWPTRGNHDDVRDGPDNDYYDFFTLPANGEAGGVPSGTEAYYSFDRANIHFICLDSEGSDRLPGGAMMTWLQQDLAANAREWTIAYWHHPPYSKGSHDSDDVDDSGARLFDMREIALPILDSHGVDLVLSGHSHSYERSFLLDGHYGRSHTLQPWMVLDGGDGNPAGDGEYRKRTLGSGRHEGAVYAVVGSSGKVSSDGPLNHPVMVTSIRDRGSLYVQVDGPQLDALWVDEGGVVRDSFRITKDVRTSAPRPGGPGGGLSLTGATPNPFTAETTLQFSLTRPGSAKLAIFDVTGRRLVTLADGDHAAGSHRARWDGRTDDGDPVAAGVYFAVLEVDGSLRTKRIVRTR